ncbi:hypothetical protein [Streptomyces aureus]|uniref:hypothetical protein n=1 Tax=Streptomyces aureus TaxID=193461 RepID=UPI001ADFB121
MDSIVEKGAGANGPVRLDAVADHIPMGRDGDSLIVAQEAPQVFPGGGIRFAQPLQPGGSPAAFEAVELPAQNVSGSSGHRLDDRFDSFAPPVFRSQKVRKISRGRDHRHQHVPNALQQITTGRIRPDLPIPRFVPCHGKSPA